MYGRTLLAVSALVLRAQALWPAPHQLSQGSTLVKLAPTFKIVFEGTLQTGAPSDLRDAAGRTMSYVENDKLAPLTPDRGESHRKALASAATLSRLQVSLSASQTPTKRSAHRERVVSYIHHDILKRNSVSSIATEVNKPVTQRDESYTLAVPASGAPATLSAPTALGLLRGLQTFSQLVYTLPGASGPSSDLRYIDGPVVISDKPAFKYRGLLVDSSRNFLPLTDLERTVDAMSWAKLNTLHWHAVDAQSWPLQVASQPQLTAKGAYSAVQTYSTSEINAFIKYANARGVEVMLEIDVPGHTSVLDNVVPDLIACHQKADWWNYAAEPPSGQLRVADKKAASFASSIFASVAKQFPGTLMSTGGDEVNLNCYAKDAATQSALKSHGITLEQALAQFVGSVHKTLRKAGKTPVVWEEMVLDHDLGLGKDVVVTVWVSSAHAKSVVDKGYRIIHAPSDYTYLDCGLGGWLGNSPNGNSWCDPFKTWQKIYSFDPYAGMTSAEQKLVLGGQALLWSEQVDQSNLDPLLWPRALAAAEVYWTGADGPNGKPRSGAEALPRIHDLRYRMVQRGVRASALQPEWCALRPGQCDFPTS